MNQSQTTTDVLRKLVAFTLLIAGCVFAIRAASSDASAIVEAPPTQPVETQKLATQSSLVTQNIEDIRLGQRVVGTNPLRQQTQTAADIDSATWRAVRLTMHEADVQYDLAFLRPLTWINTTGAKVGSFIHLELHEMGLDGQAEVVGIDACPQIEADDGSGRNVVTGTMAHPGANILYLDITGLDEPLGVTDTHPIWSETRQDFVQAGKLNVGEQFRTLTGESATLTKIHPHRGPPELVFNLEVDAEHVYCVCPNGLLVHNEGCGSTVLAYVDGSTSTPLTTPGLHNSTESIKKALEELNVSNIGRGTVSQSQDDALDLAQKMARDAGISNPTIRLDTPSRGQWPHYHVEELAENLHFWF